MRVLLIEDDSATAQSIELKLTAEGLNVFTTDLGEDAVELGELYDYDLVLDLDLRRVGLEVLRSLRLEGRHTDPHPVRPQAGVETKVEGLASAPTTSSPSPSTRPSWRRGSTRWCAARGATRSRSSGPAISRSTSTPAAPRWRASRVHLTPSEYKVLELLSLRKEHRAHQGDVPQPPLQRPARAGDEDHRRLHLQAAQEDRRANGAGRPDRDGVGRRLHAARANRGGRAHSGLAPDFPPRCVCVTRAFGLFPL